MSKETSQNFNRTASASVDDLEDLHASSPRRLDGQALKHSSELDCWVRNGKITHVALSHHLPHLPLKDDTEVVFQRSPYVN